MQSFKVVYWKVRLIQYLPLDVMVMWSEMTFVPLLLPLPQLQPFMCECRQGAPGCGGGNLHWAAGLFLRCPRAHQGGGADQGPEWERQGERRRQKRGLFETKQERHSLNHCLIPLIPLIYSYNAHFSCMCNFVLFLINPQKLPAAKSFCNIAQVWDSSEGRRLERTGK